MKICKKCNTSKSLDLFHKDKSKKDGVCTFCKECQSVYSKKWNNSNRERRKLKDAEWHLKNKERSNNNSKKYYETHREKILTKNKEKYKENPFISKNADLKKTYNITLDEYNSLLEKQNNCCAICKIDKNQFNKALAVDHCHNTGKVRGLLCINCNRMLGNAKDNTGVLSNAITYLEN